MEQNEMCMDYPSIGEMDAFMDEGNESEKAVRFNVPFDESKIIFGN